MVKMLLNERAKTLRPETKTAIRPLELQRPTSLSKLLETWVDAMTEIGLDPAPTFHGLRHTWKGNARRSGMNAEIREAIMGHGDRGLEVSVRDMVK